MKKKMIELSNVSIKIKQRYILKDFSVTLTEGRGVIGLVGLNGAGKTTFIKSIFGYYPIESGSISITSNDIAFCPDVPDFPNDLTALEVLQYSRMLANKDQRNIDFYDQILKLVGLAKDMNREISYFSRGMKQRLGIASVLVLEPKIIFFDEPTSALDPRGREEVIDILQLLGQTKLVIFSSHILNDVEKIAHRLVVVHKGEKIFDDAIGLLMKDNQSLISIVMEDGEGRDKLISQMGDINYYIQKNETTVNIDSENLHDFMQRLDKELCNKIVSIERSKPSLESCFNSLIEGREYTSVSSGVEAMDTQ